MSTTYQTRSKSGQWITLSAQEVRDEMFLSGFRYGELQAHMADLDAGHLLTADSGREFRRTPQAQA